MFDGSSTKYPEGVDEKGFVLFQPLKGEFKKRVPVDHKAIRALCGIFVLLLKKQAGWFVPIKTGSLLDSENKHSSIVFLFPEATNPMTKSQTNAKH